MDIRDAREIAEALEELLFVTNKVIDGPRRDAAITRLAWAVKDAIDRMRARGES
jgi:hypothetical protein